MFENIGKKIKKLCKTCFYVLSFCAIIVGIICFILPLLRGNESDFEILRGFFLMLVTSTLGVFLSWLFVLFIYAFGELVDSNQKQVRQNKKIISILLGRDLNAGEDEDCDSSNNDFVQGSVHFFDNKND